MNNIEWLREYPERVCSLDLVNMDNTFKSMPVFQVTDRMNVQHLAEYDFVAKTISFRPDHLKVMTEERFINALLHEMGHYTSALTNRWERIWANAGLRRIDSIKATEEQIAETLALIFHLTVFDYNRSCNLRAYNDYMILNKSDFSLPWGEIELAVKEIISEDLLDNALFWTVKVRNYIAKRSLITIKDGVFNEVHTKC